MSCHSTPSQAMKYHADPCHPIPRHTMHYTSMSAIPCPALPCQAMPYFTIQCHAKPWCLSIVPPGGIIAMPCRSCQKSLEKLMEKSKLLHAHKMVKVVSDITGSKVFSSSFHFQEGYFSCTALEECLGSYRKSGETTNLPYLAVQWSAGQTFEMSHILHQHYIRWHRIYAKKCLKVVKI